MGNIMYKLLALNSNNMFRVLFMLLALTSVFMTTASAQASNVICAIYSVYSSVVAAIFIIGLMLMILGGALYAGSHIMPGQTKGTMQGYGMGMVLGGVIGIIIAVIAPFILTVITGNSVSGVTANAAASCG